MTYADFNYEMKEFKCGACAICIPIEIENKMMTLLKDAQFDYCYMTSAVANGKETALFYVKDYDKPRKSDD